MSDFTAHWMIDVPATSDPEKLRAFIKRARELEPQDDMVRFAIEEAEDMLRVLEREERQSAA